MLRSLFATLLICSIITSAAADVVVTMHSTQAKNVGYGTITFKNTKHGLLVSPKLAGLPPGKHGMHVHEYPSCEKGGSGAGGHLDPKKTGKHLGPYQAGHLGDLPVLYVDKHGNADTPTLAPRLTEKALMGHSIIIHQHGDNYSDHPEKLGGGGGRIACGVIK